MCDSHSASQIATRLHYRKMPKILHIDNSKIKVAEALLKEFKMKHKKDFQAWQLMIIQTPHQAYSGEDDPILVVNEQGSIKPIGEFSFMLNAISDKLEHVAFLCIDDFVINDKRVSTLIKSLQQLP